MRTPQPQDVTAYDYYLLGRHVLDNEYLTTHNDEDFEKAVTYTEKAVQIDPGYAIAVLSLGYIYEVRYMVTGDERALESEFAYVQQGYALDPDLALSNGAMGQIYTRKREYDKAFSHIQRALDINPNDYEVCLLSGNFFNWIGLYYEAKDLFSRAIALEPRSIYAYANRGNTHLFTGDLELAEDDLRNSLKIQPNFPFPHAYLALALALQGKLEEAGDILHKREQENPSEFLRWARAVYYAVQGEKEQALATHINSYVYAILGIEEEAIAQIPKDAERNPWPVYYLPLQRLHIFKKLSENPRFQEILAGEKAKYEEKLRKYRLD